MGVLGALEEWVWDMYKMKKQCTGSREVAVRMRALVALPVDLGGVGSTYMGAHSRL